MNFDSERQAKAFGKKILPTLKGKGWKMRVWENLGWHVKWCLGRINLHVHDYRGGDGPEYSCLVSSDDDGCGGAGIWTTDFHSTDPNKAIEHEFGNAWDVAVGIKNGLTKTRELLEA